MSRGDQIEAAAIDMHTVCLIYVESSQKLSVESVHNLNPFFDKMNVSSICK